eukprot:735366-Pelagomonas_calceolata.AAC.1
MGMSRSGGKMSASWWAGWLLRVSRGSLGGRLAGGSGWGMGMSLAGWVRLRLGGGELTGWGMGMEMGENALEGNAFGEKEEGWVCCRRCCCKGGCTAAAVAGVIDDVSAGVAGNVGTGAGADAGDSVASAVASAGAVIPEGCCFRG